MEIINYAAEIGATTYPGRGILLGKSKSGKFAAIAYFIMGRSTNSRNRVFIEQEGGIRTEAFDPSKLVDPSLIIYAPVRVLGDTDAQFEEDNGIMKPPHFVATIEPTPAFDERILYFPMP